MAHELGHTPFGLPDLYNVAYLTQEGPGDPAGDSAGIGNWGLMGRGALGWGGDDGPASFSAWSRLRLGWAQVTEVAGPSQRILVRDVAETGELVKIPAGAEEYFLLEYRTRSSWYDRGIPAEGLLIWHVMGNRTGEVTKAQWQIDLESADGRWKEGGFPLGRTPDPLGGGDNLDFWAHDAAYAASHGGNLGDATDVFGPGGRAQFTAASNPSPADREGRSTCSITAIELTERGVEAHVEIDGPRIEFEGLRVQDQTGDGLLVAGVEVFRSRGLLAARHLHAPGPGRGLRYGLCRRGQYGPRRRGRPPVRLCRRGRRGLQENLQDLDGGARWSAVPIPEGAQAAFVDDQLPDRLYAASDGAVFVSDDGGRRWGEFPVEGRALGVWSHPADPGRTYAWVDSSEGEGRLWRLDDAGARAVGARAVGTIPVPDPWIPGGFYLPRWKDLLHTADEGATWRALEVDVGSDIDGLAVSDSERGLIYTHSERLLFRSHDGGQSWQGTGARFDRFDNVESVTAFGPSGLLIQTVGGVYVSTDRGETAVPVTVEEGRLPVGTLWFDHLDRLHVATVQSRDGERYMGLYRQDGTWQWLEGWESYSWFPGPFQVVFQDPWAGGVLIAHLSGTTGYLRSTTGYLRSTTGGATWEPLESSGTIGLPHFTSRWLHRPSIFADPRRSGVIYLADAGLWISSDHGGNWERMGPYADLDLPPYRQRGVLRPGGALLASRDSLAVLYGDSLWVGHKDGRDWKVVGRLGPGVAGLDLARHPHEPGVLYAAADAGCFVSGDGGRTWRRVLEPRGGSWRTARLRGHPRDADALYLAADRELYHSPDRGAAWRALDPGYPGVPWINDVAVDPLNPSTLYVATSAGLYSIEDAPTAIAGDVAVPRTTELMRSYPNPFNASTVIPFRLGAAGRVRIDIFNVLGQRVRRLLDERRAPGLHRVRWDGTGDRGSPAASGLYFYRLTTGDVAETRRCMLIR